MQIKDFASITASMLNWMRAAQDRVTDFEVGSVARTLLEAPAAEIDELYQQLFIGIREAIPVAIYRTFGFDPLEAAPATGIIRVTITPLTTDTLIPAGTIFAPVAGAAGVQYVALADTILPATDSWVDLAVTADRPGTAGNTAPSAAFTASPEPLGFVSAISAAGLSGGTEGETEADRQARFAEYVASLQRSTHRALRYGASLATVTDAAGLVTERVTSAAIVEPYLTDPVLYTPGLVWLYIENRVGAPSAALINRCQAIIDGYTDDAGQPVPGWKAAGVQVEVKAATRTPVAVTGTLTAAPGHDAAALRVAAADRIATYLTELPIAAKALRADIIRDVMNMEGVLNIVLSAPATDVTPAAVEKLAAGAITIT